MMMMTRSMPVRWSRPRRLALALLAHCLAPCLLLSPSLATAAAAPVPAPESAPVLLKLRDPFARPAAAPTRPAAALPETAGDAAPALAPSPWQPQLRAIMFDQGRSLVNISGAVLAAGESVHGYRVVRIEERSVVVSHGGATLTLTLDNRN